jgi:hypothetical protein
MDMMHDWTLLEILFEWKAARVTLSFRRPNAGIATIVAEGVSRADIPRANEWGSSVSVNRVCGPVKADDQGRGQHCMTIEMQSGDAIVVLASSFVLPHPSLDDAASLETIAVGE